MKTLAVLFTLLLSSYSFAADTQIKAEKVFDGNAKNCQTAEDLDTKGFLITDVQVTDLNNGNIRLTFSRPFVVCTKSGWQNATDEEFFKFNAQNSKHQTYQFEHIKPEFVLKNSDAKNYQLVALDAPRSANVAIDVRAIDLIDEKTKRELNDEGQAVLKLDVFLRTQLTATSPQGQSENWGYRTTSAFRLSIPMTK